MPRQLRRRNGAGTGLLLAALMILSGCSGGSASDTPSPPMSGAAAGGSAAGSGGSAAGSGGSAGPAGSFSIGLTSNYVDHLMPGQSGGGAVSYALFTPLTRFDTGSGKVVNAVAKDFRTTDNKVWTITLNEGWTFSNGEPVTAQSFADSWNATANPKNAMIAGYEFAIFQGYADMNPPKGKQPSATKLSGVTVVDAHTLTVTLAKANVLLPTILAGSWFSPIPKNASADLTAFDRNPVGNGPYTLADGPMKSGAQLLHLKAVPTYAGPAPAAAEIEVKVYQDANSMYTDIQAGTLDLATLGGNDLAEAKAQTPDQVVPISDPAVVTLTVPTWDPRFANQKLRQAFALAIDRNAIVSSLLKGNGTVADGIAPETLAGGGQHDCEVCTFDGARAKQLLADAGGFSGELTIFTKNDPVFAEVAEAVANQLRTNLGISASSQAEDTGVLYDNFKAKTVKGPFVVYTGTNIPNIYGEVQSLFRPDQLLNPGAYSNDQVTSLINRAPTAASTDELTKIAQQASKLALADNWVIPLYYPASGLLHSPKLSNVRVGSLSEVDLGSVTVGG